MMTKRREKESQNGLDGRSETDVSVATSASQPQAARNHNLHEARREANDEFYTRLDDIQAEMKHYKGYFKGKTILCNCDDPTVSKFFHYFSHQYEALNLKTLITTCYKSQTPNIFSKHDSEKAIHLIYEGDKNGNRVPDPEEIGIRDLKSDGSFDSPECIQLLKKADIVCTNPPFSLFREFLKVLMDHKKKFVILGNMNAVTYRDVFPLFQKNKVWYGPSIKSGDRKFGVPESYPLEAAGCGTDEHGRFIKVKGVRWFTNLPHKDRNETIPLFREYNKTDYPKYDGYDIIEVSRTRDIPMNYDGLMGVPISFLDRYNPNQFEILGLANSARWIGHECYTKINGKKIYNRIIIRRK